MHAPPDEAGIGIGRQIIGGEEAEREIVSRRAAGDRAAIERGVPIGCSVFDAAADEDLLRVAGIDGDGHIVPGLIVGLAGIGADVAGAAEQRGRQVSYYFRRRCIDPP